MKSLIGHTGFVGSNLKKQFKFNNFYNSSNIHELSDIKHDLIVCAGISSIKWKANKDPKKDYEQIDILIKNLEKVSVKKFVLISTISVYDNPADNGYGQNRLYVETKLKNTFNDLHIVRLPTLFGKGLKKNALYDLLNKEYSYLPSKNSKFQYYFLDRLWNDIEKAIENNLKVLNIATEPILFSEIAKLFKDESLNLNRSEEPYIEDMKSNHAFLWGSNNNFLYNRSQVIEDLKTFINEYE